MTEQNYADCAACGERSNTAKPHWVAVIKWNVGVTGVPVEYRVLCDECVAGLPLGEAVVDGVPGLDPDATDRLGMLLYGAAVRGSAHGRGGNADPAYDPVAAREFQARAEAVIGGAR